MMNSVNLTGRLTKDPEIKYSQSGVAVCNFTLAVNRTFKDSNGERGADFIQVVTFNKTAEVVADFMQKGSLIGIEGRIQTGQYENDQGATVWTTEVIANQVHFLEPKKDNQEENPYSKNYQNNGNNNNGGNNNNRGNNRGNRR